MANDFEYYTNRERQERENAERSLDAGAKMVHLEMAKRYATMLRDMPAAMPAASAQA